VRRIVLESTLLDEIVAHARECHPDEACGLIAGKGGEGIRIFKLENEDHSPVSYTLNPMEQLRVIKEIEDGGLDLIAIYHSHPSSPAYPSGVDVRRAFFPGTMEPNFPGVLYIIVGLLHGGPEVRAFDITDKGVAEVTIDILDGN